MSDKIDQMWTEAWKQALTLFKWSDCFLDIHFFLSAKKPWLTFALKIITKKSLAPILAGPFLLKPTCCCSLPTTACLDEWLLFAMTAAWSTSKYPGSWRQWGSDVVCAGKPLLLLHHPSKPGLPPSDWVTCDTTTTKGYSLQQLPALNKHRVTNLYECADVLSDANFWCKLSCNR